MLQRVSQFLDSFFVVHDATDAGWPKSRDAMPCAHALACVFTAGMPLARRNNVERLRTANDQRRCAKVIR
jgi:hypothetical protein